MPNAYTVSRRVTSAEGGLPADGAHERLPIGGAADPFVFGAGRSAASGQIQPVTHQGVLRRAGKLPQACQHPFLMADVAGLLDEKAKLSLAALRLDWRGSRTRISADIGWQDHRLNQTRTNVTLSGVTHVPAPPDVQSNFAQPWTYSDERDVA